MVFSLFILLGTSSVTAQSAPGYRAYAKLLKTYVVEGSDGITRVAYDRWHGSKKDREALDAYVNSLKIQQPSEMQRDEAFAYWVNLYNALTLKVILDHYPVNSIRDIASNGTNLFDLKAYAGPWRTKLIFVEGKKLSLDDIEHEILRPQFKDPRVHYAVNCASIGCPNLMTRPWTARRLETDLDNAARDYVNHPRGVSVSNNGAVTVSSIYSWFQDDFGGNKAGVIDHIRRYASPELKEKLKGKQSYDDHTYDWSLNRVQPAKTAG
jgi:hypothetical protein